ncbi:PEST proteolytic signal-containing nuclear protein-like [Marmota monax]|uniref:PEST proteolytic signal-containing nuclear protein-like n=1 Tax=Marmota monax TaxID=9995 RepID=UPI0026F1613C|nr:PEST proteolytic signal-containing nuclear protein-like [Marmota monax]
MWWSPPVPQDVVEPSLSPRDVVEPSLSPRDVVEPSLSPWDVVEPSLSPRDMVEPSMCPLDVANASQEADGKAGEEKPEKPQRVGAAGGPEEEAEKPVKTKTVSSSNGGERSSRSAEKRSAEEEAADLSTKPTKISEFGFAIGSQTTKKASAVSIKLGSGKPEETVPALAPKTLSVAAAFHEDEDSEPEEMPPEAKMRMKNIGRDTPTSAGPNSFNKGKHGFSDNQKLWERNIKSHLGNVHDQDN